MALGEKTEKDRQIGRMENRDESIESLKVSALHQLFEITYRIAQAFLEWIHRHHLLWTHLVVLGVDFGVDLAVGHNLLSGSEPEPIIAAPQNTAVTLKVSALWRSSTLILSLPPLLS